MTQEAKPVSLPRTIAAAVLETAALLEKDPLSAEERALAILQKAPGQPDALALLIHTRRLANDLQGARELLRRMADATPDLATIQYELGRLLNEFGETDAAIMAFSRVVAHEPSHAHAWRMLGDALAKANRAAEAARAYATYVDFHCRNCSVWSARPAGTQVSFHPQSAPCANG
jgi:predicted Zn-dependent protease